MIQSSEDFKRAVGKAIRDCRESKDMSLADISDLTRRSRGNLSELETKGVGLTIPALYEICEALGVKPETIIKRAGKDERNNQ